MAKRIKLKDRRAKFVDEYLIDFDGPAAAIRAGYSEHACYDMSSRLLNNADVISVLEIRMIAYKKKYEIRREKILDKLNLVIDSCMDEEKKRVTDKGNMIKAIDILSKMSGQYVHTVINKEYKDQPLLED